MAISEESRHQLHNRLDVVLGPAEASTLMAHLPPVGWADVATKHDLDALSERLDLRFEWMNGKFAAIERQLGEQDRRFGEQDRRFGDHDRRFDDHDRRFDRIDDELKQIRRELRNNLVVSVTVSAAMLGAVVAAIRL